MKRIECVLLMVSVMSLAASAQAPKSATDKEAASPTQPGASDPGLIPQDQQQILANAGQQKATEAVAVSTSVSASFSPLPADASPASIPNANFELQSQIQDALSKDPAFSQCGLVVTALADGIELTGNAGSSRERLAAWRLAESYARGKKVENHIVVNGKGGPAQAPSRPENAAPGSNPAPSAASSPGIQNNRQ